MPDDRTAEALKHCKRKALEFEEADADGDQEINFDEFVSYILPITGERSEEDLREWWALMDIDGDGLLRKDEYFVYSLCAASRKSGSGIAGIFEKYDQDASGNLDIIEFERALDEMGFGDIAEAVFDEHASPGGASISYMALLKEVEIKTASPKMRRFLIALAADSMLTVDTSAWSFHGDTLEEARQNLASLLKQHGVRLSDVLQKLDDGGSFSLSLEEMRGAFWELGFHGKPEVVEQTFTELDADGSGRVGFDELAAFVSGRALAAPKPKRADLAAQLCLAPRLRASVEAGDGAWTAGRLRSEMFDALATAGLRCVDLLRAWDKGTAGGVSGIADSLKSDNQISNKEFMVAMKKLCGGDSETAAKARSQGADAESLELLGSDDLWYGMVRDAAVDAFRRMDRSGDKSISVQEMQRWLDPHAKLLSGANDAPASPGKRRRSATFAEEQSLCYSPTKLSTRLAQVRSFEPKTEKGTKAKASTGISRPSRLGGPVVAPNCVRERVWSTRRSESKARLGPTSSTAL